MTPQFIRLALVLGLLSAIGPFAVDMYLPALPAIGRALEADVHAVQLGLMAFFVSLALSQIVYGPASDIWGRKRPLYVGITLFTIGSIGCACAPDIAGLIAFRFVQGLGAGAPAVVPRAIVRDLHTGPEATRLMSLLMLVFSVCPLLAPLAGSMIVDMTGWRAIFWLIALIGTIGLMLATGGLQESRPAWQRAQSDVASTLRAFALLMRDRRFLGLVMTGSCVMATLFVYMANSSFVFIGHYGLSPRRYSLAFALNAASFIFMSQFAGRLTARHGLSRVLTAAVAGMAATMCAGLLLNLLRFEQLPVLVAMLMLGFSFLGLVVPSTAVMALHDHGRIADAASALIGTLQMIVGALAIALIGMFVDGTARPMLAGCAALTLLSLCIVRLTLRAPLQAAIAA